MAVGVRDPTDVSGDVELSCSPTVSIKMPFAAYKEVSSNPPLDTQTVQPRVQEHARKPRVPERGN
jgi:hypothetical protein